jgi:hypothetical protein
MKEWNFYVNPLNKFMNTLKPIARKAKPTV